MKLTKRIAAVEDRTLSVYSWKICLFYFYFFKSKIKKSTKKINLYYLPSVTMWSFLMTLQWCHNEHNGISNHWRLDCLLNRLFGHRSKKTSKLHPTGLREGHPPVTRGFPTQRASNVESISIWRHHHGGRLLFRVSWHCRLVQRLDGCISIANYVEIPFFHEAIGIMLHIVGEP